MFLPKKVYPELSRKGFYHPITVLILAAITLSIAVIFFLNSNVLFKAPEQTQISTPTINSSPKDDLSSEASAKDETANPDSVGANWKTYTKSTAEYRYSLKYPTDWTYSENETVTKFYPPGETSEVQSISVSLINYKKHPPLPVYIKYSIVRTVKTEMGIVEIKKPELGQGYIAAIEMGDYTAEISTQYLNSKYDQIFDQILSTFQFLN